MLLTTPSNEALCVVAKPAKIGFEHCFSTLIGPERDADRERISPSQNHNGGASYVLHPPNGTRSHSQHGNLNSTKVARQQQRILPSEMVTVSNSTYVRGRSGKSARRKMLKGVLRQPGLRNAWDANFHFITDANTTAQEPPACVTQRDQKTLRKSTRQAAKASAGHEMPLIKAYRAIGLGRRGLWSFSQRNKARALARIEPELDINQMNLFDLRTGLNT
jgi:hypothetical protein